MLTPSGRLLLYDYETTIEMNVEAGAVETLLEELRSCDVCSLNPRLPKPPFGARDMTIELRPDEADACWARLGWETWSSDPQAKRCFDAVRSALQPAATEATRSRFP